MEYVILLVAIVVPLVALFNPAGNFQGSFGTFGDAYHESYTNLVDNVSQPIP